MHRPHERHACGRKLSYLHECACLMLCQGMLAQFQLTRSEVEQWLSEHAQPTESLAGIAHDMRVSIMLASDGVSPSRAACSSGGTYASRNTSSEQMWSLDALTAEALAGSQDHRLNNTGWKPVHPTLSKFEQQVRHVTQQANNLRAEAHRVHAEALRLRNDPHADQDQQGRIDAVLRKLTYTHHATLGDQHDYADALSLKHATGLNAARLNRRRNHRQDQLSVLRRWFEAHRDDPYPSPTEKHDLAQEAAMEIRQVEHCACHARHALCLCLPTR